LKAGELGASSEVYFFAVFAHYLLTGHLLHDAISPAAAASLCITESLPPVNRFRDERESRLNKWISRASLQNPAKRMKSIEEFFGGLKDIFSQGG
jgi:hypothetical protein